MGPDQPASSAIVESTRAHHSASPNTITSTSTVAFDSVSCAYVALT